MFIPAIIFTKVPLVTEDSHQVLFCLMQNKLPEFDLATSSPTHFAEQNNLVRHDKFDWHVNKAKPICYFFEKMSLTNDSHSSCEWLTFPQAIKKLSSGTHRNLLQLAVQYISYGMIDDSVVAAEYDKEWVENLK